LDDSFDGIYFIDANYDSCPLDTLISHAKTNSINQ
jgi:hypothetical protein